jgi:hypothetical protein
MKLGELKMSLMTSNGPVGLLKQVEQPPSAPPPLSVVHIISDKKYIYFIYIDIIMYQILINIISMIFSTGPTYLCHDLC